MVRTGRSNKERHTSIQLPFIILFRGYGFIKKIFALKVLSFTALVFFLSCASNSTNPINHIEQNIYRSEWRIALAAIESEPVLRTVYPRRNALLFFLDRGILRHYAGLWQDSINDLHESERRIEAAFTRSISQEIGTFIANDNARDYPGEDYEDIYINVFNALNFYHLDNLDGALVEIRRVNEKLRYLSLKYDRARQRIVGSYPELDSPEYNIASVRFSNSALARYLGVLFYRASGNYDSARVDFEGLYEAFRLAPQVYNHRPPVSIENELSIPDNMARLNIIGFTGLSPKKEEVNSSIPLPLPSPNNRTRLALPRLVDRPSAINRVEVLIINELTTPSSIEQGFRLELLENINNVVNETFRANHSLTVLKSTARTIAKSVAVAGVTSAIRNYERNRNEEEEQNNNRNNRNNRNNQNNNNELLSSIFSIAGRVATDLSEQADIRMARFLPGAAYVGGINLEP